MELMNSTVPTRSSLPILSRNVNLAAFLAGLEKMSTTLNAVTPPTGRLSGCQLEAVRVLREFFHSGTTYLILQENWSK